jgi:hypothetical protein
MKKAPPAKPVERLFPFVLRSRILLVGRDTLQRSKSKLRFVLITTDISQNSRAEILSEFAHYPVVQYYQTEDLEKHFGLKGSKVVGFAKSGLARSLYAELKQHRINKPPGRIFCRSWRKTGRDTNGNIRNFWLARCRMKSGSSLNAPGEDSGE